MQRAGTYPPALKGKGCNKRSGTQLNYPVPQKAAVPLPLTAADSRVGENDQAADEEHG